MVRAKKIKRDRSLKYEIFLIMVFVAILPMAIYLYLDIFTTREKYRQELFDVFTLRSAHVQEELERMYKDRSNDLMILAKSPVLGSSKFTTKDKLAEMRKVQDFYHYFDDITYIDSSGNVILSTTYSYDSDISKLTWFKNAVSGSPVISPPYLIGAGSRIVISFFQPVFKGEELIGVLTARMDIDNLWRITDARTLKWGSYGHVIVLDEFGEIISHPDKGMIFKKLDKVNVEEAMERGREAKFIGFTNDDGMKYVGTIVESDEIPGTISRPYYVLAVQAEKEAFSHYNYMIIRDLLQLTATGSLIILLSLYFSNRLTRPIEKIIDGTKRISEGGFGKTIEVKSWEELNSIASAFNSMSIALKENTEQLISSERRYRTLVEDIDEGYFLLKKHKIVYYNEAAARLTGYESEEALGLDIIEYYPEKMRPMIREYYQKVLDERDEIHRVEIPFFKKDGEQIFVEFRPTLISSKKEEVVAGIMVDISARKRREEMDREYQAILERAVQKKTRELSESEEKYRTLFENVNEGIFVVQDGLIKFTNPKVIKIYGYSEEELIGRSFVEFVHPDDVDWAKERYIERMKDEKLQSYPYVFRVIDGEKKIRWVEGMGVTIDWEGKPAALAFLNDVTEKRLAEEALKESEEKFRNIFETSKDVIYITTIEGEIIDINPAAEGFFGYTREELIKLDTRELYVSPDERKKFQRDIEKGGFVRNYELTMKKKDGTLLECIETATVLRDDKNNIVGYHGTIKDITERKRMETLIKKTRDRLMTAFDAVSDRMYIVGDDYRLRFVNKSISSEIGLEFGKLIGNKCYSFFNTKDEPCAGCPVSDVIEKKEGASGEVFVGPEWEESRFFVSAYPIRSEEDRYDFLIYSRDVTEEKKMEENLIQHDRLVSLGRLSAGVAHEINNPLSAILGYTQLLMKNIGNERKEHDDLKLIEEQVLNCKTILDNLLIFSRARVDRREYFILEDILANVIMLNKKELKEKKIKVTKKLKNTIPTFHGDKIKITQVFLNILQNSIYAVDRGGKIAVETYWDEVDNRVMITFTDDGPGISDENIKRIFDPFFTTKPTGKGTGLGLSVSYGIVREHGGVIVAESPPGKGAKFTVFLPIGEEVHG